jgi:transcription elongation factor GreA
MKAQIVKKFEDEIHELERELRTELPKEIKRARELGDLSENAEYQAAKERQRYLQARIGMLKKRVAEISLMNLEKIPKGRIAFGSTVHLKEDGSDVFTYQLVMPEDLDDVADRPGVDGQGSRRRGEGADSGRHPHV